jgi:hypothetical protein
VVLTFPLILLLAVIVALLLRFKAVDAGAFVASDLYLAHTGAADTVNQLVTAVTDALPGAHR